MKKTEALDGAGITREEADEILRGRKRVTVTAEQRRQHLALLKRAAHRAKDAPVEKNGEAKG